MSKIYLNGIEYGGSIESEDMLLSEYLALPEAKQNDGTLRFIPDMDDWVTFVHERNNTPLIGDMHDGDAVVVWAHEVALDVKPACPTPVSIVDGYGSSGLDNVLTFISVPDNEDRWSSTLRDYTRLWVGADYGDPIALNAFTVAPRTYASSMQIYTAIMEGSNDLESWIMIGESSSRGNDIPAYKWFTCAFDNITPYRYYRLRTEISPEYGNVNGSVTYTLSGLGFLNTSAGDGSKVYTDAYYKKNNRLYRFHIA